MLFWSKKTTDPVCGMKVMKNSAAATREHLGKSYYFCSQRCEKSFAKKPRKYLKREQPVGTSSGGGCH